MMSHLSLLVVLSLFVSQCHGGCSEVDSMTEAVAGEGFLLGCISCKRREEVSARATVDWHFKPLGEEEFRHIFHYDHPSGDILHEDFSGRLEWHGTQDSDIQTGAIYIHNVTFNDTGMYLCEIHRTIFLSQYDEHVTVEKEVELSVVAVGLSHPRRGFVTFRAASPSEVCRRLHREHSPDPGGHAPSIMPHCPLLFPSQSGDDSGGRRDNDVRADRGPAAVAHCDSGLLLQEDFRGARSPGGP